MQLQICTHRYAHMHECTIGASEGTWRRSYRSTMTRSTKFFCCNTPPLFLITFIPPPGLSTSVTRLWSRAWGEGWPSWHKRPGRPLSGLKTLPHRLLSKVV